MSEGRSPHYFLKAVRKLHGQPIGPHTVLGAAWIDEKTGAIDIRLNPCIVIDSRDEIFLKLFPAKKDET